MNRFQLRRIVCIVTLLIVSTSSIACNNLLKKKENFTPITKNPNLWLDILHQVRWTVTEAEEVVFNMLTVEQTTQ